MSVLLIGARGQLGSDLTSIEKGMFLPWTSDDINLLDLEKLEQKLAETPFEAIVNCAAYNKTEKAEEEPSIAYGVNGHAVGVMAKMAQKKKVPFIHISTDFVFDGKKGASYVETDLPAPLSVYGASKALGEAYALSQCEQSYVLRTASLYGKGGSREKKGHFIDAICKKGAGSEPIKVVSDIFMSPTSTLSLAKAILSILKMRPEPGLYHAVNGGEASWYQLALAIGKKYGFQDRIEPVSQANFPSKIRRPLYSVLSNEKINPIISLPSWEEALSDYLQHKDSNE